MLSELKKDKMSARILNLAKLYGPFVRFYPEGTEKKDDEKDAKDALDEAIKTGEKAARTPEEQRQIDEARRNEQQLEQERSNAARANEATRQVQSDLESTKSENESLKEQLASAQVKAAEAGITDVELDEKEYEGTDLGLVRAIKGLKQTIDAKDDRISGLEKKAAAYEKQDHEDRAIQQRNSAYEELLSDLDEEYGPDSRNEALKKFNELVAQGKLPKGRPEKATRLLERCYKEAKAAKDKAKGTKDKSSLPLDSGSGGGSTPNLSGTEIKEGSLDEVDAQVAKTELGTRKS